MAHFQRSAARLPQRIGQLLQEIREQNGLQLEDIAEGLCIQKRNLEYLEKNEYARIPEMLYRELFLKTYSTYLGLNWEQVKAQYVEECALYDTHDPQAHTVPQAYRTIRTSSLWVTPNIIRNFFLTIGISVGFLYIAFLGWSALQPPQLVIFQPQEEFTSSDAEQIVVSGQTRKEAHVTINGQAVAKKQDGTFVQEVALSDGMNVITVTVSKKFSRPQSMIRKVIFEKQKTYSYKN
ncbi:helix-turn-helix domain-containing protein [Candidatus Uhrbacteria bacterium]|nr:helix-turn-helix domain-containing protein [Candidatus Uhrbacteria bacterium]